MEGAELVVGEAAECFKRGGGFLFQAEDLIGAGEDGPGLFRGGDAGDDLLEKADGFGGLAFVVESVAEGDEGGEGFGIDLEGAPEEGDGGGVVAVGDGAGGLAEECVEVAGDEGGGALVEADGIGAAVGFALEVGECGKSGDEARILSEGGAVLALLTGGVLAGVVHFGGEEVDGGGIGREFVEALKLLLGEDVGKLREEVEGVGLLRVSFEGVEEEADGGGTVVAAHGFAGSLDERRRSGRRGGEGQREESGENDEGESRHDA